MSVYLSQNEGVSALSGFELAFSLFGYRLSLKAAFKKTEETTMPPPTISNTSAKARSQVTPASRSGGCVSEARTYGTLLQQAQGKMEHAGKVWDTIGTPKKLSTVVLDLKK